MGLRIWQTPGTVERAEWLALSGDPLWEVVGGMWMRPAESGHFVVLIEIIPVDEPGDEPVFGQARWVDLDRITLPEKRAWGMEFATVAELVRGVARTGHGHSVGSVYGTVPKTVRTAVKQLVDAIKLDEARLPDVPKVHHRRWDEVRRSDPTSYTAGFLTGMRKADLPESDRSDEVMTAGWEHGWEYAVGRAPLPDWYMVPRKGVSSVG